MLQNSTACSLCDRPASDRCAGPHLRRRHPRSGPVFDLLRAAQSKSTTETQRGRAPTKNQHSPRRHGGTEKIGKKQSQKQNPTREQPRTQRKFGGEWKSMKISVKEKTSKVGNAEAWRNQGPKAKSQWPICHNHLFCLCDDARPIWPSLWRL